MPRRRDAVAHVLHNMVYHGWQPRVCFANNMSLSGWLPQARSLCLHTGEKNERMSICEIMFVASEHVEFVINSLCVTQSTQRSTYKKHYVVHMDGIYQNGVAAQCSSRSPHAAPPGISNALCASMFFSGHMRANILRERCMTMVVIDIHVHARARIVTM